MGLFLLLLLLLASCQESDDSPVCPSGSIGILQGFVLGGGVPVLQEVRAVPASGWQPSWQSFETMPEAPQSRWSGREMGILPSMRLCLLLSEPGR
jgi:hypothetical protein